VSREESLLERIASWEEWTSSDSSEPRLEPNTEKLVQSVRRNLVRLLNSRHGLSAALPDYGLPAFADLRVEQPCVVEAIRSAMQASIEAYEPRLRNVRVTPRAGNDDCERLVFRIDAVLAARPGIAIWYETRLTPGGEVRVEG
jgi:type VI secretion system protein